MPRLRDRAPDEVQDIYGWCGLCNAFSGFPHLCTGEDHPAEDQDDNGLNDIFLVGSPAWSASPISLNAHR